MSETIGIEGQWQGSVKVGERSLAIDEIVSLLVVEDAGNLLPTFRLSFSTADPELTEYELSENSLVQISFGTDSQNQQLYDKFKPTKFEVHMNPRANGEYIAEVVGILDRHKFLSDASIRAFAGNSSSVMKIIAQECLVGDLESDPIISNTSSDSMTWLQYNITPKEMVQQLWMHGYFDDNVLMVPAITSSGQLIYSDLISKLRNRTSYDWVFMEGEGGDDDSQIVTIKEPFCTSSSGFLNHWAGNERFLNEWNFVSGVQKELRHEVESTLSDAVSLSPRTKEDYNRYFPDEFYVPENMHSRFHEAKLRNLINLAIFSLAKVKTSSVGIRKPKMKILDSAMLLTQRPSSSQGSESPSFASAFYSGKYIITRIGKSLSAGQYSESYELCRDGFIAS